MALTLNGFKSVEKGEIQECYVHFAEAKTLESSILVLGKMAP